MVPTAAEVVTQAMQATHPDSEKGRVIVYS